MSRRMSCLSLFLSNQHQSGASHIVSQTDANWFSFALQQKSVRSSQKLLQGSSFSLTVFVSDQLELKVTQRLINFELTSSRRGLKALGQGSAISSLLSVKSMC